MAGGTCTVNSVAAGFLNLWFCATAMSPAFPTSWFLALDTGTASANGLQFEVSSGNAYARLSETRNTTQFTSLSGTANAMNNAVTFSFATATGAWTGNSGANTTVQGLVVMDAASAGNAWFWGPLTTAQTVVNNNILQFLSNNFTVTLS